MNVILNHETQVIDLGLMDYHQAWDYQANLHNSIIQIKKQNRSLSVNNQVQTKNYLLFCEHPAVYTLGKSGDEKNLLIDKEKLTSIGTSLVHTNRGGDITFHGPGQLVVYPVIDLENFFTDIHRYMRLLEEAVIQTLKSFSLDSGQIEGLTGVWIDPENIHAVRKICALGVRTSRWVTMHGLALNINTDLRFFDYIVPCGISDKTVTSFEKELGQKQNMEEVKRILRMQLARLFDMKMIP